MRAGRAQSSAEHHVDGGISLREGVGDDDALTGSEPVGLHDDRGAARAHVAFRRRSRAEALVGGGWNFIGLAQILGEALGAFELRGRPARAEGLDAGRREVVDDAGAQRRLGSDYAQIDFYTERIKTYLGCLQN